MMKPRGVAAALAGVMALAAAAGPVAAQRFRSGVETVRVDVLVLGGHRPVAGLTAADFELRDRGVAQQINDIQIVEVPFSMMLALDASSSMQLGRHRLQEAARAAVAALHEDDRVSVMTFTEHVGVPTPWTAPREAALAAIDGLYSDGSTNLADAAFSAILQRDPEPGRRNLVILFTDGSDMSSWLPDDAAIGLAERSEIVVYCVAVDQGRVEWQRPLQLRSGIRLSPSQPVMHATDFLRELATRTGGQRLSTDFGGLQKVFRKVVGDFRSRYVLTYNPSDVDAAGWHPIEVRLKNKPYTVTARRGYER